ncbi:Hint domain-containing protein [Shimia biformata]|uniref:Hint domain-containing protein n=1 Tax=Shimia biformata TaxID=1294299 RepID=UPI0019508C18|nr:Hint domain-containing protein [Shimia biformata]
MRTGFRGTFVISWSQTELDGQRAAPMQALQMGAAWSWHGDAVRVDGPGELLRLDGAEGEADVRKRAARMVHRLVGAAMDGAKTLADSAIDTGVEHEPLLDGGFVVTDGSRSYGVTAIPVAGNRPLLMFIDELPPRNVPLWVVHQSLDNLLPKSASQLDGGVICFTPGTVIATPDGPRRVETLREGDRVSTKDNGAQEVVWIGSRKMTGARLFAMPRLRPIRIRAGALGIERPDDELVVSPEHRLLIEGPVARALFNTPEVMVAARELVNDHSVIVDHQMKTVTYVHLLLPNHEVLWANGVETESFHPVSASLAALQDSDRERLLRLMPELGQDPHSYGGFARRFLSASEAAILQHEAA